MALRKEQAVLLAAAAVAGFLLLRSPAEPPRVPVRPNTATYEAPLLPPDILAPAIPEQAIPGQAVPPPSPALAARDLFLEPSEEAPLPPRELLTPPLAAGHVVAPPLPPGPDPSFFHLVRLDLSEATEHAFGERLAAGEGQDRREGPGGDGGSAAGALPHGGVPPADPAARPSGRNSSQDGPGEGSDPRFRYDHVRKRGEFRRWGRILNEDRYDLRIAFERRQPLSEPVRFQWYNVELDRPMGAEETLGADDLEDFGFAETLRNDVELAKRRLSRTPADLEDREALIVRLLREAPRNPWTVEEAEALAREWMEIDPSASRGPELLARVFRESGRIQEELALYQELIRPEGTFRGRPFVWRNLGLLQARLGLDLDAEESLRRAVRLGSADAVSNRVLASFLAERGRPQEAWRFAEAARRLEPTAGEERTEIRATVFATALARGDLEGASTALGLLRAAALPAGRLAHNEGALAYAHGDMAAAERHFQQAAAEEAFSGAPFIGLGMARMVAGHYEEARQALELAADRDPLLRHLALAAQGLLMEWTGNQAEALARLEAARVVHPGNVYVQYLLGRQRRRARLFRDAEEALDQALARRHDFVEALGEMGLLKLARAEAGDGDPLVELEAAALYAARACELEERRARDPWYQELLGLILLRRDELESARRAFTAAVDWGASPFSRACLALVAYRQNRVGDSMMVLEDLLRDPAYPEPYRSYAQETLERIRDHRSKVQVRDRFQQAALSNHWQVRTRGNNVDIHPAEGRLTMRGALSQDAAVGVGARRRQENPRERFLSVASSVETAPGHQALWTGLEILDETARPHGTEVTMRARVGLYNGRLHCQVVEAGGRPGAGEGTDPMPLDHPVPPGSSVRLGIEVRPAPGEAGGFQVVFSADGTELASRPLRQWRAVRGLYLQLFAEGDPGQRVHAYFSDFLLIRRVGS